MSKHLSKQEIIKNKKKSIIQLNDLLESYISDKEKLRKADLLSKWLKDYVNYLKFEDIFDPKRNISYKRGNIVKVNLGFNLGSELGGVHYAIIIDNNNKRSCDTVTILPLSSVKENSKIYERDLLIGNEFYNLVASKYNSMLNKAKQRLDELNNLLPSIIALHTLSESKELPDDIQKKSLLEADKLHQEFNKQITTLNSEIEILQKNKDEIDLMKEGSIVKIEQIRTISKIRIWIPKTSKDPLYNISLSQPTMDKINSKLMELFIFQK